MPLPNVFKAHGRFCATHPWEVIVGTVTATICLMSIGMFTGDSRICGWNYKCEDTETDIKSSDILILTITKCLAVIYIYLQFRSLRRIGSKYLLGIAGLFTIFSSFVFSIAVVNLAGSDLTGLNEALPFFLLLVDLSKASTLARFALSAKNQEELKCNIAQGMSVLGPAMTLDVIVESLAIGVGTISGLRQLETMCCFGCLSVVANYVAFMTFYPACLALTLETSQNLKQKSSVWQLAVILQEEEDKKPNPVVQRIKLIMSGGLVLVHAHSRWVISQSDYGDSSLRLDNLLKVTPEMPLWQFYFHRLSNLNIDYSITLALACILTLKYVLFDDNADTLRVAGQSAKVSSKSDNSNTVSSTPSSDETGKVSEMVEGQIKEESKAKFHIGEDSDEDTVTREEKAVQTVSLENAQEEEHLQLPKKTTETRSLEESLSIFKSDAGPAALTDSEVLMLVRSKHIPAYKLEGVLGLPSRGVSVRRQLIQSDLPDTAALHDLPHKHYDYTQVDGACAENVIGYMPVPVGVAGPLLLDGRKYTVPMATTEGCLIASTNRGCRALSMSGGVSSCLLKDGMSRAPVVRLSSAIKSVEVKEFIEDSDGFELLKAEFDSTSRFGRLQSIKVTQAGRSLYLRFVCQSGDAMGMNMVSKGCEKALRKLSEIYPELEIVSLSGNYCVDKKPSAVNWIEGRGKSVVCEAVISSHVVKTVLKTTVPALVELNVSKNLVGSALAGSIGGNNAHAANVVAAIFIACGQDAAQVVGSSNCMTLMEATGPTNDDLLISCTMPTIEVGTVGGGTVLTPQSACLSMLGLKGSCADAPGRNSQMLARVVCASVLAAELSLMSALAAGHLVKSHLRYNRSTSNMAPTSLMDKALNMKKPDTASTSAASLSSTTSANSALNIRKHKDEQQPSSPLVPQAITATACKYM
ncbi:3-hydroxy-3-methylglutaryl-coenzyme A reductase-like [Watersipora subatra]|uniref:3-hydroxy-3-methylglutaryl-coenzyme A reductase-like n=1 Tax=Watersipora subatra TaxID=2589382 RepID=UPI00355ACDC9